MLGLKSHGLKSHVQGCRGVRSSHSQSRRCCRCWPRALSSFSSALSRLCSKPTPSRPPQHYQVNISVIHYTSNQLVQKNYDYICSDLLVCSRLRASRSPCSHSSGMAWTLHRHQQTATCRVLLIPGAGERLQVCTFTHQQIRSLVLLFLKHLTITS